MLECTIDPSSDDDQHLMVNKEEEGDDEMINYWSGDDGNWFFDEVGRDFPHMVEDLYDITEVVHVWEPLKKDKKKSVKPWRRKKTKFIMPIMGPINNWTWVGFSENMGKSSNVLFNIFNKMNSDLAYFDVSHNIEILHLNDSNKFENEINKQLEKKIEPMEPTLETINLSDDENPCLIKIGLTLNEKERKDL